MSKRKKITDIEKFYILGNPENLGEQALADKVQCAVTVVRELKRPPLTKEEAIKQFTVEHPEVKVAEVSTVIVATEAPKQTIAEAAKASEEYQGPKAKDLMGRDRTGKRGFAIMTPAASEAADEFRNVTKDRPRHKYDKNIHRPRG